MVSVSHDHGGRVLAKHLGELLHAAAQMDERRIREYHLHRTNEDAIAVGQLVPDGKARPVEVVDARRKRRRIASRRGRAVVSGARVGSWVQERGGDDDANDGAEDER